MFTLTNLLYFILFVHIIATLIASVLVQFTKLSKASIHEAGIEGTFSKLFVKIITALFIIVISCLILPAPYAIITAWAKGKYNSDKEVEKAIKEVSKKN